MPAANKPMDPQTCYHQARQHHQAGDFHQAEALYRKVLDQYPEHPNTLCLLGTLYHQQGRHQTACEYLRQAVAVKPDNAYYHYNLGLVYSALKKQELALQTFQQALHCKDDLAEAYDQQGRILRQMGQLEEAAEKYRRAVQYKADFAEAHNNLGIVMKDLQRYDEASTCYRQALQYHPVNAAEIHNNLGFVLLAQQRPAEAIREFRQALEIKADDFQACYGLALTLQGQEQADEALQYYLRALKIRPDHVDILNNVGSLYSQRQQYTEALKYFRRALQSTPRDAGIHYNIGNLLRHQEQFHEAIKAYRQALDIKPDVALTWNNLGLAQQKLGQLAAAEESFRQAVHYNPEHAGIYSNYGNVLCDDNRPEEGIEQYREAIRIDPDFAEAWNNMGMAFWSLGENEHAIEYYQKALQLDAHSLAAYNNLGNAYNALGQYQKALSYYQQVLELDPENAETLNNIGNSYNEQGQHEKAYQYFSRVLEIKPQFTAAHSNLLFLLSYNVLRTPVEMLAAHQEWDQIHGSAGRKNGYTHANTGDPDKRLRIGYVSPDFRLHAVSFFIEPILRNHHRQQVEVYCYAEVSRPDNVMSHLQAQADHWRNTIGLTDETLAHQIHEDGIDILIDLAGHTAGNRLGAFSYKPAPVQASYLGYFTTTGLAAMDYWISDEVLTPADTVELCTEEIYRLPRCCLSYQPPAEAPAVIMPQHERITFGSFNHLSKISPATIALWSAVLHAVPTAQLLLKSKQLTDSAVQDKMQKHFAEHGISADRLVLLPMTPTVEEHLGIYGKVDIALDTIPRTGGSTTTEALWMGVPVITLAGERFIERLSATMLSAIGLEELVTRSQEDFVACAVALAQDHQRRTALRANLRQRMARSSLCDAADLCQVLENAYRSMWHKHLSTMS